jgi:hypothetical protein
MNKQITDIHNQAILFSLENGGLRISSHIPKDYIEKFAELIIKECAKFLDDNSGYDDVNGAWYPEPEELLKHFEIE